MFRRLLRRLTNARMLLAICPSLTKLDSPGGTTDSSPGRKPWERSGDQTLSPEGAILGSQGREPLVMEKHKTMSPRRGATLHVMERSIALPGLFHCAIGYQGLTPLATEFRPSRACDKDQHSRTIHEARY